MAAAVAPEIPLDFLESSLFVVHPAERDRYADMVQRFPHRKEAYAFLDQAF